MVTLIASSLLKTLESIATPCSVKTIGRYLTPPQLEVTNCDLKLANSSWVNSNIKSSGNLHQCSFLSVASNRLKVNPFADTKDWLCNPFL